MGDRTLHGGRDIVKLEIQKKSSARRRELAHQRRAFRGEQPQPDLQDVGVPVQLCGSVPGGIGVFHVECDNQSRAAQFSRSIFTRATPCSTIPSFLAAP